MLLCLWLHSSTDLDSINDDVTENDEVDSDQDSGVQKNCNEGQGMSYNVYLINAVFLLLQYNTV